MVKQQTERDPLVPDPQVAKEFGITRQSIYRWDRDAELGFPPKIQIQKRNYRSRQALDAFKDRLMRQAIRERAR